MLFNYISKGTSTIYYLLIGLVSVIEYASKEAAFLLVLQFRIYTFVKSALCIL